MLSIHHTAADQKIAVFLRGQQLSLKDYNAKKEYKYKIKQVFKYILFVICFIFFCFIRAYIFYTYNV